jgi:hypothetical protein
LRRSTLEEKIWAVKLASTASMICSLDVRSSETWRFQTRYRCAQVLSLSIFRQLAHVLVSWQIPTDALLQAVSDFFVEEGLSATDAATVAKEFVALLQEERTTDENSIERSNSLNAIIQALSNKMADNVDPDNVAEWRRTSKPAWIGEDLVTK